MHKLCFYVPEEYVEEVKNAIFGAGGGVLGHYEQVSWQCLGTGQFKPLGGAKPVIGKLNELAKVSEYKVEMLCSDESIGSCISALLSTHPYEEVAYDVIKLEELSQHAN